MVRELFRVGEEANALVPVLEALSQTLQGQLDQSTQRLLRLLTPILTLVIGGAVGALVYSIMGATAKRFFWGWVINFNKSAI